MAVSATKAHVIITADSKSARNAIDQMKTALANLEKEIKKVPEGSTKWKSLNNRIANLKSGIEQSEREFASLSSVLNNLSGSSFRQLQRAYSQITQQIKSHSRATKEDRAELSKMIADQKRLEVEMHKVSGMWKTQEGAINSVIKRLSAYVAVYGGFNMIMGKVTEMTKKNLEFSDTISDIQKVSGLSQKEVEKLTGDIAKIDSRNSQEELDRLAYAAGKLGIGTREGAQGLLEFTKAADQLQVALKEYLGEDGIVSLMKVADVMGDTKKYGVEQALLKNGSALNFMTQSTSATADYMVDFISRTGGMAKASNITTPQLIGLASALDSLGQKVEVSGTAMNKFFAQLMTHYGTIAKATGLNKEWIKSELEQGQTMEVVMSIFDKLGTKGGLSALGPLFKDLGSDGARLMQVMTQLANNSDRVRAYVSMANQAFKEGTSVTNEYNIKNQNAAAIMARMANAWEKFFVNAQNAGAMKEIATDLYNLTQELLHNKVWVESLTIAFKALVGVIEGFIRLLPAIVAGFSALKIFQVIKSFWSLVTVIRAAGTAMEALKILMTSNWWGVLIAAVSAVGMYMWNLCANTEKAKVKVDELGRSLSKSMAGAKAEIQKTQNEVDKLFQALNKENLTQEQRKNIIAQINTQYKDYLPKLLSEKSSAIEIANAWEAVNQKLRANILLKAKQEDLEKITEKYSHQEGDALQKLDDTLTGKLGNSKGRAKGASANEVYDNAKAQVDAAIEEFKKNGGTISTSQIVKKIMQSNRGVFGASQMSAEMYNGILNGTVTRDQYAQSLIKRNQTAWDQGKGNIRQTLPAQATKEYNDLLAIRDSLSKYAGAKIGENRDTRRVNEYYGRILPADAEMTETSSENNNVVISEDTTKEDKAAAKAAAAAERKELREMRKEAQEELKGIKSIIDAFYQQREAEIQADFESGLITEVQRTELLSETAMQKAKTMIDAWNVMLKKPGSDKVWAERLKAMEGQIYGGSAEMETTLEDIGKRNLEKTGKLLENFGTSMTDGLKRTVAQNENILETHLSDVRDRIHAALKEYDYVYKALDKAQKNMETQGMVSMSEGTKAGVEAQNALAAQHPEWNIQTTTIDDRMKKMMTDLNSHYQQLFTIDINTDDGVKQFTDMLSTVKGLSEKSFTQGAQESQDAFKERMQLFYQMLLEMGEGVEQAQKNARQEFTTSAKLAYKMTGREEADKDNIEQAQMGVDTNSKLGTFGLDSTLAADDMEIKLYEAKLEAAANYYDFLKERGADEVTLREQEMAVEQAAMDLADKMTEKTVDKLSALKEIGTSVETFGEEFGAAIDGSLEDRQDAFKNLIKGFANVTKKMIQEWVKQRLQQAINNRLMEKQTKVHQANEIAEETATSTQRKTIKQVEGTALTSIQTTTNTQLEADQKAHDIKDVAEEGTTTTEKTSLNLATAISKCFSSLGPIGGAVAAAVVTAAIGAVLAWAMSKIGGSADTPDSATASTTKLASGMLTYDKGNVQMFRTLDNGDMATVTGTDGQSYNARVQSSLDTGVVSSPVATLINGQPSIVGEKGSEMVIGRQTFAAMRSLRPDLVQQIVRFDKNRSGARFRTYDDGNVSELGDAGSSALGLGTGTQDNAQMMALITSNRDTNVALTSAITSLNAQLAAGIGVRKYGSGGVVEEVADGFNFLKGKSSNKNIKRLFG